MKRYYVEKKDVLVLPNWPRLFGDVMPLETLWMDMLANLTANNVTVDSEQQLWEVIEKVWHKLCTAAYVKQLFNKIPDSVERVVANRGEYIN